MSHFVTNRIVNPTGSGPTFDEWVHKILKQAEEAKPGLGQDMSDEPRGQQRGQTINTEGEEDMTNDPQCPGEQGGNARPDTGGTTDAKTHEQKDKESSSKSKTKSAETKSAKCGKEMGESSDAGKVTEQHSEAGPGDDENPDPKVLINNDPNYQKGESTNGGKGKSDKKDKKETKANLKSKFQKIASMNRLQKLVLFAQLSSNKNSRGVSAYPIEYVEAISGLKFANLTKEEKTWFSDFWKTLYPAEYVAEMVKDR